MNPNSILAMAFAMAASNPPLMHELEHMFEPAKPEEPKTQADLDRIAAAQVKGERKANKRRNNQMDWKGLDRLNKALFGGES